MPSCFYAFSERYRVSRRISRGRGGEGCFRLLVEEEAVVDVNEEVGQNVKDEVEEE